GYPEWDFRKECYRRAYCAVREVAAAPGDPSWSLRVLEEHRSLFRALRRRFEPLRPRRERRPRQLDGEDIDLDAFVDDFTDRSAGRGPGRGPVLPRRPPRAGRGGGRPLSARRAPGPPGGRRGDGRRGGR